MSRLPTSCIRCPKCDQCSCLASHEEFPEHCLPVMAERPEPDEPTRVRNGYQGVIPSEHAHPLVARLTRERLAFGMSRSEVAKKAGDGLTAQNLRYIETTVSTPRIHTVEAFARAMGYRLVLESAELAPELDNV